MALPNGHASRAEQCAANIRIAMGWLADEPLSPADVKVIRAALAELEERIKGASS